MDELIQELKSQGVLRSPQVEAAFRTIDRKDFVPPLARDEAYGNYPIPIGQGQTISQPYTVAFMLDLLDPKPGEHILDIGAGSGWQTALLAYIVSSDQKTRSSKQMGKIIAIERVPELYRFARENLTKYNFIKTGVVDLRSGDVSTSIAEETLFDSIIAAAASTHAIPQAWRSQVRIGGRIVAPVDESIWRYTKRPNGTWAEEEFPGFAFVPLVTEPQEDREYKANKVSGRLRRLRYFMFSILFIFFAGLMWATFIPKHIERTEVEITNGMGSRAIGSLLKSQGLVKSRWVFLIYTTVVGQDAQLKPGTYEFEGAITLPRLVRELVNGESNERTITIPEGWDLADLATYFESTGMYSAEAFFLTTGLPPSVPKRGPQLSSTDLAHTFSFLRERPRGATLEGFLFPDTYRIWRDASITDVISKMLANFDEKISPDLREEMRRTKRNLFEIVTMASLVEKEVADESDRKIVAGILWKRLDLGIPLQVDATVNYVTGKKGSPNASDLATKSPYNTYQNRGLPPGPIANPGLGAILAALRPTANPYLYYLSTPEGNTIFSRSLEEHNIAKARYLGH